MSSPARPVRRVSLHTTLEHSLRSARLLAAESPDVFRTYRDRLAYGLALVGAVTMVPFTANAWLHGRTPLAALTGAVSLLLGLNAFAIYRRRSNALLRVATFLPALGGLAWAVRHQGMVGVMWAYPALMMFHFMFDRRVANALNGLLLAIVVPLVAITLGLPFAARAAVTLGLIVMFANIFSSVVAQLQAQLEAQATVDPLTGAFNRRQMAQRLGEAIEQRRRYGTAVSLLALDIDHFKRINDELGHAAGDDVLRGVVELLRARLRQLDQVFRAGGEEFLLLLPGTPIDGAVSLAESVRFTVETAPLLKDRRVTVSIGVAEAEDGETVDAWVRRADDALYAAKHGGRNRIEVSGAVTV